MDLSDYALSADVSNELSNKLDTTAFSDVSGSFLTAVDIPQSATWNEVSTTVQSNSAQWAEGGTTYTSPSGTIRIAGDTLEGTTSAVVGDSITDVVDNGDVAQWMVLTALPNYPYGEYLLRRSDFQPDHEIFCVYGNWNYTYYEYPPVNETFSVPLVREGYPLTQIQSNGSLSAIKDNKQVVELALKSELPTYEYDSSNKISAINGSAIAAGGEFPQSATEAIETVTANSADWNSTTDTVSSNSGVWGGSALPISAGPGIKFEMVNDTLVASTSGYVWQSALLFHTNSPVTQTTYTLSDDCNNYDKLEVDFYDINGWRTQMDCSIPTNLAASGTRGGYFSVVPASTATNANVWFKAFNWTAANTTWSCYCSEIAAQGGSTTQTVNANQPENPPKVVNIIGWKRVGGN